MYNQRCKVKVSKAKQQMQIRCKKDPQTFTLNTLYQKLYTFFFTSSLGLRRCTTFFLIHFGFAPKILERTSKKNAL